MKNILSIFLTLPILLIRLAACAVGGQSPEPDFEAVSAEAVARAVDTAVCTEPSGSGNVTLFPQEGREIVINGFDFPAGDLLTLRLTAVTDSSGTQIERTPTVGENGSFRETVTLPQYDYMRWAVRLYHNGDIHCYFIVMGQNEWLEIGYEGPQALTGSVQSAEEAIEQDLAAISEATGASIEELEAQMAFEGPINELMARLTANEAATFGGLWIERQPEYRVVVAFTADGEETVSQYVQPGEPLWDVLAVRDVTYSEAALMAQQEALNDVMRNATFDWASYVDIVANKVVLEVVSESSWQAYLESNAVTLPESVAVLFSYRDEELAIEPPANLRPVPDLYMAQRTLPSMAFEEALLMDMLLIENNCVFAESESGERTLIIWQPGFFVHDSGDGVQILDEVGKIAAKEGEPLFMGGGGGTFRDSLELVAPIPERCQTENVWYMGEFLPEALRDNVMEE